MEKERNITYDYVRGLAMLSIVIGHLYYYSGRYQGALAFDVCNCIELPVFMYVSGLLAHVSIDRYGFRKLLFTRCIRLLFPFISFYIIKSLQKPNLWTDFWLEEFKRGYWFMLVLFELMITLSFVKSLATRLGVKSYWVNGAFFGLVVLFIVLLPKGSMFNQLLCVNLYAHYYPFFMLGYYSYCIDRWLTMRYAPVYLLAFVVAFCFCHNGFGVMKIACNLSSLLFLMTVCQSPRKPLQQVLAYVGVNSLQVYMLHSFLLFQLIKVLPVVENRWLEFACFLLVAAAVIAVTIAIARLLMKNSWLAMFLFGIRRKKPVPVNPADS